MKSRPVLATVVLLSATRATLAPAQTAASASPPAAAPQLLKAVGFGGMAYPGKGQGAAQLAKDDGECFDWTRQPTGIDPSAPVANSDTPAAAGHTGACAHGAVRGAARGAIAGEIIDDKSGEGAALGAMAGAARSARTERAAQAAAAKETSASADAAPAQQLDTFRCGYGACMEVRGYTLK